MKKERKTEITILPKPNALEQIPIYFSYLDYLCVNESTVLGYLQLPQLEEVKDKDQESITAFA